jgi:sarcosine oxidase subunit beta
MLDDVLAGTFHPRDGLCDPSSVVSGYVRAAGALGARLLTDTEVVAVRVEHDRVTRVVTSAGEVETAAVVNAAGPFAGQLAALAGLALELRPTIRTKLILPEVPEVPPDAPMTIEEETAAHWRPGLHGAYALWTDPGTPPGEPLDNVPPQADFAFGLLNPASDHALARLCPFWQEVWDRNTTSWVQQAGQYDYTPDHRPLLGPTAVDGFFLNAGYSGHGIMTSTAASRIVVDTLLGRLPAAANPFRPDRPMVERPLDIL